MATRIQLPPQGFDELPIEERIDYVHALWNRIAASGDQVPVHDWQARLLAERLAAHRAHPDAGRSWEDVLDDIQAQRHPR
jgi:putative addiction module component (TIGR02574 family)